jgi:uncharacterized protein DUF861
MRKKVFFSIVCAVLLLGCGTGLFKTAQSQSNDPSRFIYTRLYCTPDIETHFETVTINLSKIDAVPPALPVYAGGRKPASLVVFTGYDAHWGTHDSQTRVNHPAPAAQFVVFLAGIMSVTTTDGETRHFRTGDLLRVEDTAPCKGHITPLETLYEKGELRSRRSISIKF